MDLSKFKPMINELVQYYYSINGNECGGKLHVVLDDHNVEHATIFSHWEDCQKENDHLGAFICEVLRHFTEEELEQMYETNNYWGMLK